MLQHNAENHLGEITFPCQHLKEVLSTADHFLFSEKFPRRLTKGVQDQRSTTNDDGRETACQPSLTEGCDSTQKFMDAATEEC